MTSSAQHTTKEAPTLGDVAAVLEGLKGQSVTRDSMLYLTDRVWWEDVERERAARVVVATEAARVAGKAWTRLEKVRATVQELLREREATALEVEDALNEMTHR